VGCTQSFLDHIACRLRFELFTPSVDLVAAGDVGGLEISWLVSGTADVLAARPEEDEEGFHEADEMRSEEGAYVGLLIGSLLTTSSAGATSRFARVGTLSLVGSTYGEVPFLFSLPQPFTVRTTSLCRVLSIRAEAWQAAAAAHPRDAHTVALNVCSSLREMAAQPGASVPLRAALEPLSSAVVASLAARDAERVAELCFAAARNDVLSMRRSLAAGGSVSAVDYDARSPLHIAAAKGAEAAVSYLLDRGAPHSVMDAFGNTPLMEAALNGHTTVAAMLRASGAVLGLAETGVRPVGAAARRVKSAGTMCCATAAAGDLTLLSSLILNGLNPNAADYDSRSGAHVAASLGRSQVLAFLLDAGADPNATDAFGRTPLLEACRAGHEADAELLRQRGGRLGLASAPSAASGDALRRNELHAGSEMCQAASVGDVEYLRRLLRFGCEPDSCDYDGRTAAHLACAEGWRHVALLLMEHGADFSVRDRWGHTPASEALRNGHEQLAAAIHVLQPTAAGPPQPPLPPPLPPPPPPPPPPPQEAKPQTDASELAASELAASAEELLRGGGNSLPGEDASGSPGSHCAGLPAPGTVLGRRRVGQTKFERIGPWLRDQRDAE